MSQLKTKFITNNAVTNPKLAQMPTLTLKGNNTGGTANAADLTVSQVNTMLGTLSSALAQSHIFVGSAGGVATDVAMSGEATIIASGAVTLSNAAVIAKLLTGFTSGAGSVSSADSILSAIQKIDGNDQLKLAKALTQNHIFVGSAGGVATDVAMSGEANILASGAITLSNAAVIAKLLTGYSAGGGVVSSSDSILSAIQKIDGNVSNLSSIIQNFEWQPSVLSATLLTPPGSPSTGDRYLINGTGAGGWTGHDNQIAQWSGSAWVYTTATTGTFVGSDAEPNILYLFGGSTWTSKAFESTTASTGLTKVGFDIRIADAVGTAVSVTSGAFSVLVDNSTIAISGNNLVVKTGGITNTQVSASAAIAYSKLALAASIKASDMNSQTALSGQVLTADGLGGASYLPPAATSTATEETFALSGTNITNQFIDLAHVALGASNSVNSVSVKVAGAPPAIKGTDYSVSLTGGSGGVTRITFLNDYATGGVSALDTTDTMIVDYSF